ncbi:MAG: hypothetical protein HY737_06830 [Candidatus Omnitrophica bacterium]|nr:hypothetical protein [Candidatus Omnitrophota bacterium]
MSFRHATLAAGRWKTFTFLEQMANVASEVERALNWRTKNNPGYAQRAFERALELLDLTLGSTERPTQRREVARVREALVDFFSGANSYGSTDASWRGYFLAFAYAARRAH